MPLAGDYDPAHAINANTVFLLSSHPSGSALLGKDLVSETSLTLIGSSVLTAVWNEGGQDWRSLESVSTTAGGAYMATNATIRGISNAFSIFGIGDWDSFAGFANLIACPYNADWTTPFQMLGLARGGTGGNSTAHGYYVIAGPSRQIIDGATNSWPTTTGVHSFAATRSGATARLYYDGSQVGSDLSINSGDLITWPTDREFVIGNRHPLDQGEGIDGRFRRVQVWSRQLSGTEIGDLHATPKLGLYLTDTSLIVPPRSPSMMSMLMR